MIYYTSDLHLGHSNIIGYENRPYATAEEMDADLIYKWNAKVGRNDDVYVLGDFCFKGATKAIKYIDNLNGRIHFIRGNHDKFLDQLNFQAWMYFNETGKLVRNHLNLETIKDQGREVVLCHYPLLYWQNMEYDSCHLYGHVHSYRDCSAMAPNSFNVGVDVNNYMPVTLDELLERRKYE